MEDEKALDASGNAPPNVEMFNKVHEEKQRTTDGAFINMEWFVCSIRCLRGTTAIPVQVQS